MYSTIDLMCIFFVLQQKIQEEEKAKRDKPATTYTSLYSLHDFDINIELDLPIASKYEHLISYIFHHFFTISFTHTS